MFSDLVAMEIKASKKTCLTNLTLLVFITEVNVQRATQVLTINQLIFIIFADGDIAITHFCC